MTVFSIRISEFFPTDGISECFHYYYGELFEQFDSVFRLMRASWRQILRNLDPITGTRMYSQILKLVNERREKKMIEEKKSLKSQLFTKKEKKRKK